MNSGTKLLIITFNLLFQFTLFAQSSPTSIESICDEDDRVGSNYKAVGRIWKDYDEGTTHIHKPIGSAFIISNGKLITAGHVAGSIKFGPILANYFVEFNVPSSDINGIPSPAADENRYKINKNSITDNTHHNHGPSSGDDWAVIQVDPNSVTGLMPIVARGKYFNIKRTTNLQTIRITGYGKDSNDPTSSYTQQTDEGPDWGSDGNIIRYRVDTEGVNSGSPIIDELTPIIPPSNGTVVGVHTFGNCSGTIGSNGGTSFYNDDFWDATGLGVDFEVDQLNEDDERLVGTNMGRWESFSFKEYPLLQNEMLKFSAEEEAYEILRADQNIVSNPEEKYNNWRDITDIENHHKILIETQTQFTTKFKKTYSGISLQNNFLDEPQLNPADDEIEFKDPWFIDYQDPLYGNNLRNRGMDQAVWRSRSSPFNPDFNDQYEYGQPYKGIFLNQNPTFDPLIPNYSVKADQSQDIYLSQTGKTHRFYFQNWSGTDVSFEDATALETGVVFTDEDAVVNANLKGTQLSNDAGAYLNNSQRKFVRTDDGDLHMVYESMGKAWYEISTDGGLTWQIANNGQPLSGSEDSKLPAIDYRGDVVVIVWQEKISGAYNIKIAQFGAGNYWYGATIFMDVYLPYSSKTNPVVSWDSEGRILVMWKRDEDNYGYWPTGIVFSYGALSMLGWNEMDFDVIPTTNSNSINPTLVADKDYNLIPAEYHLAWEEPAGFYTYIKYFELYRDGYNEIQPRTSSPETPSNGAGFWTNRKPSIIVLDDHTPRLVWIGYTPWYGSRTVFRAKQTNGSWSSTIINYGSYSTESVNINRTYDNNYAFVFSESYTGYQNKYVKSSNLWEMRNLGTTGKDIQVCNAANFYSMYCLAFQSNVTLPYRFVKSSSFGYLKKITKKIKSIGRAAIVTKDSAEFIYALGNVLLNDEPIKFKDVKDTIQINSQQELNNYLKSKPFHLDDGFALTFSVVSGVVNPGVAAMLLEEGKYVKFKVELIEDKTGEILNSFAILEYNANNVEELTNLSFSLKTSGMRKTKVHLKILLDENISGEYTLSELIAVDSVLHIGKEGYQEVSFGGDLAVIEYALKQNYPNPFNPSTTLKYQIPQNGFVTLKVYDILGKEVATLVNEVKTQGRYEATFDASYLASGVYLYRLNVNDYVDVKKMILLK